MPVYQKDILGHLLLVYMTGNSSSSLVLTKMWKINPDFFTRSIMEMYSTDANMISRILDIAHELKVCIRKHCR